MKKRCLLLLLLFVLTDLLSQNLVPNPSFEVCSEKTNRWSGTFSAFNRRIQAWQSPTQGSPDLLFDQLKDKMFPPREGFDLRPHFPRTGSMMIGLKTYGCEASVLHCREYLQVKLTEHLHVDQQYEIEFYVNPLQQSIMVNNIGAGFSMEKVQHLYQEGLYEITPMVNERHLVEAPPGEWVKICGTFTADSAYNYLLLGNFFQDDQTSIDTTNSKFNYSFLLLDDVSLRPIGKAPLTIGSILRLNNIEFEFNESKLKAKSHIELAEILDFMLKNQQIKIEISGHTDNSGTKIYNQTLSEKRAKAVADYLISNGIQATRISTQGYGENYPLTNNDTESGRKMNRRVEIEILAD